MAKKFYETGRTAPNQDQVIIGQHKKLNGNFVQVSKDSFQIAARTLKDGRGTPNGGALILYMHLQGQASGWTEGLSPAKMKKLYGLGESAYDSGKKILIEQGYLVQTSKGHYTFYEDGSQNSQNDLFNTKGQNDCFNHESCSKEKTGVSNTLIEDKTGISNTLITRQNIQTISTYNIIENTNNNNTMEGFVGPSLRSGTTPQQQQEEEVVGHIRRWEIKLLEGGQKVEYIGEDKVRITNCPKEGVYQIDEG